MALPSHRYPAILDLHIRKQALHRSLSKRRCITLHGPGLFSVGASRDIMDALGDHQRGGEGCLERIEGLS
jgi:hypothetical protein